MPTDRRGHLDASAASSGASPNATLAMYGEAFDRLQRFAVAASGPAARRRDAPRAPLGGAAARRAAWRRARSPSRCRRGAASIAGSVATGSSPPIRSTACAHRARRSRCRRRSRSITRSRWSTHRDEDGDAAARRCATPASPSCSTAAACASASWSASTSSPSADAAAGWIDAADGSAHVLGKGRKRRAVPVGAPALAASRSWLAHRDRDRA